MLGPAEPSPLHPPLLQLLDFLGVFPLLSSGGGNAKGFSQKQELRICIIFVVMFISDKLWDTTECSSHTSSHPREQIPGVWQGTGIWKTLLTGIWSEALMFLSLSGLLETFQQLQLFCRVFLRSWMYFKDERANSALPWKISHFQD